MPTPHKHAAVIKAWADGAEIQFCRHLGDRWQDTTLPEWLAHHQYRVKPQCHEVHVVAWINSRGVFEAECHTDKAHALSANDALVNNSFVKTPFAVGTLKFSGD